MLSGILHGMSPAVLFSLELDNSELSFDYNQSANPGADNLLLPRMLIYEDEFVRHCLSGDCGQEQIIVVLH